MKSDPSLDNSIYVTIERWFQDHYTMLCQRALRLVKDKGIAEDLVQNTFFKLWRKGKTITMPDSVEAFLKRMVFNEVIDWLRKNKRYEAEYDEELLVSNPCELDINNNNQTEITKKEKATLVVAKLDRLSRNVEFTSALFNSGVEFICCDNFNPNNFSNYQHLGLEKIKENARTNKAKCASNGCCS